jgi:glutamate transport system substrate-binding protein
MKFRTLPVVLAALALAAAACGESNSNIGGGGGQNNATTYQVAQNPSFAAGSTMERLSKAGAIKVGIKYDQPGIGNKNPANGQFEGFDVEVAKIIAGQLGLTPDKVNFTEAVSKNREPFIQTGNVDIVVASYSITDKRKKIVSFAGPYYVTGQDLLIRKADQDSIKGPDDLAGKKVCSVTGSTPLANIEENYKQAKTVPFSTYTECVDQLTTNQVDAVTTDGAILLGYAAKDPTNLQVVGKPFSTEKYGIGLKKDDKAFRDFINDALEKAFANGDWQRAYDATLGKSGSTAPSKPTIERY